MAEDIVFLKSIDPVIPRKDHIDVGAQNLVEDKKIERERERSMEKKTVPFRKKLETYKIPINLSHFLKKMSDIKIIDGKNAPLFESIINIINCESKIAIDTEHYKEPSNKLRTSSLQISTPDAIYIFDILSIMEMEDWEKYIKKIDFIFKSEDILKLCYEPVQDLKVLNYTTKYKYFSTITRIIDLAEIKTGYLEKSSRLKIKGLKGMVELVFKKTLDKEEQTSDWVKRPLSEKQIEYAALDSFILFKLYLKVNVIYSNKFYDLTKNLHLSFANLSCRTNVELSKFTKKEENLILIDEK